MQMMSRRSLRSNHQNQASLPNSIKVTLVVVLIFLVGLLSFILIVGSRSDKHVSPAYAYAMQTQTALNPEPTPTPFQPDKVGYVPEMPSGPDSPPDPDATPVPTQRPLQKPEGQVNVLLLGTDLRENDGGFRTDTIIWLSLNPKDGFVSVISFPRDLFVEIPGYGENRINVAFGLGGFDLLADTMEINFGVRPDHYVLIHMNGFTNVINDLGGIYVDVEKNLTDSCAKWINHTGICSVGPGTVHMNADVVLWYVRSRHSTNDVDRARRAQEVIEGIFKRLMSFDVILKAPELYAAYTNYVDTDVDLSTVISLLPLAKSIHENGDMRNYVIGFNQAYSWITTTGANVLVPDKTLIRELLIEALELKE